VRRVRTAPQPPTDARRGLPAVPLTLVGYGFAFGAAQLLAASGKLLLGATLTAALAVVLSNHSVRAHHRGHHAAGDVYACLTLVPVLVLVRHVLEVGVGAPSIQHVLWAFVATLAAAAGATAGIDPAARGMRVISGNRRGGVAVILVGPLLGLVAYAAAQAAAEGASAALTAPEAMLIVVAVSAEGFLFHGPLQRSLMRATTRASGVTLTVVFHGLAYVDVSPVGYAAAFAAAGAVYAIVVAADVPLFAVIISRVLLTLTALSLWPNLVS
jgi:hypothetical protein